MCRITLLFLPCSKSMIRPPFPINLNVACMQVKVHGIIIQHCFVPDCLNNKVKHFLKMKFQEKSVVILFCLHVYFRLIQLQYGHHSIHGSQCLLCSHLYIKNTQLSFWAQKLLITWFFRGKSVDKHMHLCTLHKILKAWHKQKLSRSLAFFWLFAIHCSQDFK